MLKENAVCVNMKKIVQITLIPQPNLEPGWNEGAR